MIVGENPRRIEYLWQILYRGAFWRQGVVGMSANSGINQALWDIKGKDLGKPVYELLGGPVRDKVRMYTHFGGETPVARYQPDFSVEKTRQRIGWYREFHPDGGIADW